MHGRGPLFEAKWCNATSPLRRVKKPCAGYLGPVLVGRCADSSGKHSQEARGYGAGVVVTGRALPDEGPHRHRMLACKGVVIGAALLGTGAVVLSKMSEKKGRKEGAEKKKGEEKKGKKKKEKKKKGEKRGRGATLLQSVPHCLLRQDTNRRTHSPGSPAQVAKVGENIKDISRAVWTVKPWKAPSEWAAHLEAALLFFFAVVQVLMLKVRIAKATKRIDWSNQE